MGFIEQGQENTKHHRSDDGSAKLVVTLTTSEIRELIHEEMKSALNDVKQIDRLMNAEEASNLLSVSQHWLYRNSKKLPFARKLAPKVLRFSYQGIQKWLSTRKVC